jgi:hypothetical protein
VTEPRPCSAAEAVARALSIVGKGGQYELGTGDYRPQPTFPGAPDVDLPWTTNDLGARGSDCAGFAGCWCYKLPRHRPGYNRGPWSTCSDDLNCNSKLEDARHGRDLFAVVTDAPQPGDILAYPTIYLPGHPPFCGHECIVVGVSRAAAFDISKPDWSLLDVAQCCGPNGRAPAVVASDGSIWNQHDHLWPKPEHRSELIRALP